MVRRRSLISAYYILTLDIFGFAISFSVLPILLLNHGFGILKGIESEVGRSIALGVLLAAFPLGRIFGTPFFGGLADWFGRKRTLLWTISGTLAGYGLTAIGGMTQLYSLLLISRLITGFFSGNITVSLAILADLNEGKKERGKAFSLASACIGVGWIAAICIGMPLAYQPINPSLAFWVVAACTATSLFVLWKFYDEPSNSENRPKRPSLFKGVSEIFYTLKNKQIRVLYAVLFFWFLGFFISLQWAAPLESERYHASQMELTWFWIALGTFWALSSGLLSRWLIEHSSMWKIALWSLFFMGLFFFFGGVADFYFYFSASYMLSGIFAAVLWGTSFSLISLAASAENQGKSIGIGQAVQSLGQFFSPLIGGLVAGLSIELIYFASALLVLIGFLSLLIYIIRRKSGLLNSS